MPAERPAEAPTIPVEVLRHAVRERVNATSVRAVAEQTGMSPTGLWRFLQGTAPYTKTQRRLQHWYVLRQSEASSDDEVTPEVARAAIELLTRHLSPRRRAAHVRRVLDALEDPGGREPAWLAALRGGQER